MIINFITILNFCKDDDDKEFSDLRHFTRFFKAYIFVPSFKILNHNTKSSFVLIFGNLNLSFNTLFSKITDDNPILHDLLSSKLS